MDEHLTRVEVADLIVRYCFLLDDQEFEAWAQLFAEDAVLKIGAKEVRGRNTIRDTVTAMQPAAPGKHLVGTPLIRVESAERVCAWTDMVTFLPHGNTGYFIAGLNRYHDIIIREQGQWVFRYRAMGKPGIELPDDAPPVPS